MSLSAHWYTIWPVVRERALPQPVLEGDDWTLRIRDPDVGPVRLHGKLRVPAGARELVILVHGLGGSSAGRYMTRAARVADAMGLANLRLGLRGADPGGSGDLYHAGLSSDLAAVVASPAWAGMAHLYVLGFSLGGHMALKLAAETDNARLRAVAAVSSPLDLERTVAAFDRPGRWLYRRYLLAGLCDLYEQVARDRELPVPPAQVRRARTLREFDRLTVVPRFGFASPEDYYRRAAVGPRLGALKVPALLVVAEDDPMVDAEGIRPALAAVSHEGLEVRWCRRGGHVSFPADLDLGLGPPLGLERQVLRWLRGQSSQATGSPTAISPPSSTSP